MTPSPCAFEARLRAVGADRYHDKHPVHHLLHCISRSLVDACAHPAGGVATGYIPCRCPVLPDLSSEVEVIPADDAVVDQGLQAYTICCSSFSV